MNGPVNGMEKSYTHMVILIEEKFLVSMDIDFPPLTLKEAIMVDF